jgi:hypothetical protein
MGCFRLFVFATPTLYGFFIAKFLLLVCSFVFSMFGKDFFVGRYRRLGWEFREATPRQAIRVNFMNVRGVDVVGRLKGLGFELEEIPFIHGGYWVVVRSFQSEPRLNIF